MMSVIFDLHISRVSEINPDTIELLANDGKVTANRAFLRLASSAIHKQLTENPEITIFDMKNHKKTTIDLLVRGIYYGKTTVTDEVEKEEVISLAQELDITIVSIIQASASKVSEESEEQSKDVDPKVTRLKDGRVSCDVCFKIFSGKWSFGNANTHYKEKHLSSNKIIDCRFQGCDKKFANMITMKRHMYQSHGISAKQITSTTKTKSSTSFTKLTKKAIELKQESIED